MHVSVLVARKIQQMQSVKGPALIVTPLRPPSESSVSIHIFTLGNNGVIKLEAQIPFDVLIQFLCLCIQGWTAGSLIILNFVELHSYIFWDDYIILFFILFCCDLEIEHKDSHISRQSTAEPLYPCPNNLIFNVIGYIAFQT